MLQIKLSNRLTDRSSIILDRYLSEITKYPVLSPDEEVELFQQVKEGDKRAKDKFIKCNLKFVVSIAKQYQRNDMPLIDIINEGNIGLLKAIDRFDETQGFKFISYAVWWIRQSILEAINSQARTIKLPANRALDLIKINDAIKRFQNEYYTSPSSDELTNMTGIDIIPNILETNSTLSLDAPFKDTDYPMSDTISNNEYTDTIIETKDRNKEIDRILKNSLDKREYEIIVNFFGINCPQLSLDSIAEKLNITRERARQIKEKSLKKLGRIQTLKFI